MSPTIHARELKANQMILTVFHRVLHAGHATSLVAVALGLLGLFLLFAHNETRLVEDRPNQI